MKSSYLWLRRLTGLIKAIISSILIVIIGTIFISIFLLIPGLLLLVPIIRYFVIVYFIILIFLWIIGSLSFAIGGQLYNFYEMYSKLYDFERPYSIIEIIFPIVNIKDTLAMLFAISSSRMNTMKKQKYM